ncbi:copper resistance protein CopD, partial [Mycobacterium mantenii]
MTVAPPAGTASTEAAAQRRALVWPVLAGVAVLAGCTAAGIGTLSLASALTVTGLPDPGQVTTLGLPFVRAAGEIAAVLAVGSFLLAAFLVPPQRSGVLDTDGYRALRLGTVASGVWAVCAALLVPLTISDVSGHPVADIPPTRMWSLAGLITNASAWRWTALLAAVIMLASLSVLRWSWTPVLAAASVVTLIPLGLTGHSSAGGSHDLATNGLLIHLVAASLWAGGLLALLAHVLRGGGHLGLAARRFSTIALWCWVAMAVSGLVNAVVRVHPSDLLGTDYGRLVTAKFVALCLLGGLGWRQRRVSVAALQADPSPVRARGALLRLTLIEAAVFGLTFGIAVGLGRTPPPP